MIFSLGVICVVLGFVGTRQTYTARDQLIDRLRRQQGLEPEFRPWSWADTWGSIFMIGLLLILASLVKVCLNYLP